MAPAGKTLPSSAMFWDYGHFENFIEDVDEFAKGLNGAQPVRFRLMKVITEAAFKTCLASILGDSVSKDWGGEVSDHFSAHIHLKGQRYPAAFLLKGPGNGFTPMTLNHLGENNDQIVRLAREPARLLVVQHCH